MSEMQKQEGKAADYQFPDQDQQKELKEGINNENATLKRPGDHRETR